MQHILDDLDREFHKLLVGAHLASFATTSPFAAGGVSLRMGDSTDAPVLPFGLDAYAGYIDGNWQSFGPITERFPHAHLLPITVRRSTNAPCIDIEPGNLGPDSAVTWWVSVKDHIERPCFYAARADMSNVLVNLRNAGIPRSRYRVWVAHPDGVPHLCSAARCGFGMLDDTDATQFAWNPGGVNIDLSLTRFDMFGAQPKPVHHVYDVLLTHEFDLHGRKVSERNTYLHAAGAMAQPVKYHAYLGRLWWDLKGLRDRVKQVSTHPMGKDGKPTWGLYNRGARWQVLNGMMGKVTKAYEAHA